MNGQNVFPTTFITENTQEFDKIGNPNLVSVLTEMLIRIHENYRKVLQRELCEMRRYQNNWLYYTYTNNTLDICLKL